MKSYRVTFDVDGVKEECLIIMAENKTDVRALFKKLIGNKKIKSIEETKDISRKIK